MNLLTVYITVSLIVCVQSVNVCLAAAAPPSPLSVVPRQFPVRRTVAYT